MLVMRHQVRAWLWLALAVYVWLPRLRRLALTRGWARGLTLAFNLATSGGPGLCWEARHGGQHQRLDVENLDIIVTLDQPLLRL